MTDDSTRQTDLTPPGDEPPASPEAGAAAQAFAPDVPPSTMGAAAPVAAGPVASGASGPSRTRWLVALGVVALAAIVAVGAFVVLSSQPTPEALKYVPGDAIMVMEIRPELPGDQMQNLGSLLAHFPGFLDQSTLTQKLDEAFGQLISQANIPDFDYQGDVKPWLSGPAFIGVRTGAGQDVNGLVGQPGVLLSATTNGQVTCASALQGRPTTTESYNGVDLLLVAGSEFGCIVQGKQGLLGDRLSLRAALDAKSAGSGMDRNDQYTTAHRSMAKDYLATVYLDGDALQSVMSPNLGSDFPTPTNPLGRLSFAAVSLLTTFPTANAPASSMPMSFRCATSPPRSRHTPASDRRIAVSSASRSNAVSPVSRTLAFSHPSSASPSA